MVSQCDASKINNTIQLGNTSVTNIKTRGTITAGGVNILKLMELQVKF
jgi:hypothetical protein